MSHQPATTSFVPPTMLPVLPTEEMLQTQIMVLIQRIIERDGDHPRTMHLQCSYDQNAAVTARDTSLCNASLVPTESYSRDNNTSSSHGHYHAHHHQYHHSSARRHHEHCSLPRHHHEHCPPPQQTQASSPLQQCPLLNDVTPTTGVSSAYNTTFLNAKDNHSTSEESQHLPNMEPSIPHENTRVDVLDITHTFASTLPLETKIRLHHVELVYSTVLPQPAHGELFFETLHFPTITEAIHHARTLFDNIGHADLYIRITSVWRISRRFKYSTHRTTLRMHHVIYDRGGTKKNHNHTWIKSPLPSPPVKRRKI